MRLFVAAEFDDGTKKAVMERSRVIRLHSVKGNFTAWENLHLTFAFLGDVDPNAVAALSAALDRVLFTPFALCFAGVGSFASGAARTVYLPVADGAEPVALAGKIRTALAASGFSFDPKPFVPHLTIVRDSDAGDAALGLAGRYDGIATRVVAFALFESVRVAGRLVYRKLHAVSGSAGTR